jgi:hypothetical protein
MHPWIAIASLASVFRFIQLIDNESTCLEKTRRVRETHWVFLPSVLLAEDAEDLKLAGFNSEFSASNCEEDIKVKIASSCFLANTSKVAVFVRESG